VTGPAWPDAGPDTEPAVGYDDGMAGLAVGDRETVPIGVMQRLGPVGIAAIIAAVLVLFGVGALVVPLLTSQSTGSGQAARPPAGASGVTDVTASDAATPSAAPSTGPSSAVPSLPTAPGNPQFENEVVALVNAERGRAHCQPVRNDERLRAAARAHSVDMATNNFVNHTGSDGSSPLDRMQRAGYGQGLSEDIARGGQRSQDVVRSWMHDKQDRANILDCDARAVGVGLAYRGRTAYWTQNFGRA
jgi:uncharacterized protein YkwD